MSAALTLARVVAALDAAGARHMIVGSFASTFHGEPRATQDIDIVVEMGTEELDHFVSALPETDWYVDRDTARDALRRSSMFNVVDLAPGWKIDNIVRKPGEFAATAGDLDLVRIERWLDPLGVRELWERFQE